MRFADINNDIPKLKIMLAEKQVELEQLRFAAAGGSLKQMHRIRAVRRDIAQINTVLYSKRPAA